MITEQFDFPGDIPAAAADDPAKPWRVMDASGKTTDYAGRQEARQVSEGMPGSSALYFRKHNLGGVWKVHETLLREG